jgi:beta-xylosidase
MTIFEWILVVNLVLGLYLAYVTYKTASDLEDLEEAFVMQAEIIGRFIRKITAEKVEAGEWTEHETF